MARGPSADPQNRPGETPADDELGPYRVRLARALAATDLADGAAVLDGLDRAGLGDGLPVVPPSADRMHAMLAGRNPEALTGGGPLPIAFAKPTWGDVATAAVLAGCRAGALPLIAAALDAVADPAFNLLGVQTTTGAAAPLLIVHGAAVTRFGCHAGAGSMGAGHRANLTIGRAVRLVLADVGICRPGEADMATHGHPGKVSWLVAENQAASPWPSLSARRGRDHDGAGVTVFAGVGSVEVVLPTTGPDAVAARLAEVLRGLCAPDAVLVLPPESASFLTRHDWDLATLDADLQALGVGPPMVVVSGGTGIKATVVPGWGGPTAAVTRWIEEETPT